MPSRITVVIRFRARRPDGPAGAPSTDCSTSIELPTPNVLMLITATVNAVMLVTPGSAGMMVTTRPGRLIFVVAEQQVFVLIAHRGLPGWTGLAGTGEGSGLRAPSRMSTRRMIAAAG
jgi:hypothetical protein